MFAIVEIAGKQYKVKKGDVVEVDKLSENKEGDKLKVEKVLVKFEGDKTEIGSPYLAGSYVDLVVKAHTCGEKQRFNKFKRRKRYVRTIGHRQEYTKVEVVGVK
ncbi:50S ribosomal protein L21 [Candidatus Peregrinibacteria bacterium]|nr:50S ribosomal protein L21 [Candidatus Peregrinibacteria bacterium]